MRLKIISDGTLFGTRVETEDGETLEHVVRIVWSHTVHQAPQTFLEVLDVDTELIGTAEEIKKLSSQEKEKKAMADNGWLDLRAAEGQREAFRDALKEDGGEIPPFQAFRRAMKFINPKGRGLLLDVGCGAGGYAALVDRYWPHLHYMGCDISPYMIEFARQDYGDRFFVRDAMDLDERSLYVLALSRVAPVPYPTGQDFQNMSRPIILASSLIEVCPNWREVLSHLLGLPFAWLILGRARVWNDYGQPTSERTYTTLYKTTSFEVTHNQQELTDLIRAGGGVIAHTICYQVDAEGSLLCLLVEKESQ